MGAGTRLKKILEEKNITIKDLSVMSGVSINTLYGITKRDNDTINSKILNRISDSLNVPAQYILGLDGYADPYDDFGYVFDEEVKDTPDGLLLASIDLLCHLTTEGRVLVYEYAKQLEKQQKYLDKDYLESNKKYQKWFDLESEELKKMYQENIINEEDYQKVNFIIQRKLFIPFHDDDDAEEDKRLCEIIDQVKERLKPAVLEGKISCPFDLK